MRFRVPKKLRVGGMTYKLCEDTKALDTADLYGQTFHVEQQIKYHGEVTAERQEEIVIHESLHVINRIYELGLEESQISRLSHGVHEVIQQLELKGKE